MTPSRITPKMFVLPLICAALLFSGTAFAGIGAEVVVSRSILINLPKPSTRVSLANPAIADLTVISPTQLQLIGSRIGITSLIVWDQHGEATLYDVRVKGDLAQLEARIKEIAPRDSITVEYANDTLVLAGRAINDRTIARVVLLANSFVGRERESGAAGGTDSKGGDREKITRSDMESVSIDQLVQMSQEGRGKVLNLIQVVAPQQVLLEVKVAQVDKEALKSLGVSLLVQGAGGEAFSNLVGAPDSGPTLINNYGLKNDNPGIAGTSPWLGAISPLSSYQLGGSFYKAGIGGVLKALVTKDQAKILAEPNLLVKSGHEGNFFSGKKLYYPVVTANSTDTKEITVGVKLKFRPEVLEDGQIKLRIDPAEVSAITGTMTLNNSSTPVIDTREIRTDVQLKDGESLVLGGLLQEETIRSMSKIPLLGDFPILGALFRSTRDDRQEKELLFFITPKLVTANPPGSTTKLPTDTPLTPEEERELQWLPLAR